MSLVNSLWLSSYLSRNIDDDHNDTAAPQPEVLEPFYDSRDNYDWLEGILDSPRSRLEPELEARLVGELPALFATTLPPCGLETQIAFQNVLHRLRHLHIYLASFEIFAPSPATLTLCVCERVANYLKDEELGKAPWRRQNVFLMERKWASWFFREAQLGTWWDTWDDSLRETHRVTCEEFPVPVELKIGMCNKVKGVWGAWRAARRKNLEGEDWEDVGDES